MEKHSEKFKIDKSNMKVYNTTIWSQELS